MLMQPIKFAHNKTYFVKAGLCISKIKSNVTKGSQFIVCVINSRKEVNNVTTIGLYNIYQII